MFRADNCAALLGGLGIDTRQGGPIEDVINFVNHILTEAMDDQSNRETK